MTVAPNRLRQLLAPYVPNAEDREGPSLTAEAGCPDATLLPDTLLDKLGVYLDLLLRWNSRTNLTAIREPEEIVQRHFGESLFLGFHLRSLLGDAATVLDFGSGAGFPGLPLQLLYPDIKVTLAESQGKKASFLREASRVLEAGAEIWASRVEQMPLSRMFDAVTLRAVDDPEVALYEAARRLSDKGVLALLAGEQSAFSTNDSIKLESRVPVPLSRGRYLALFRSYVPRGT